MLTHEEKLVRLVLLVAIIVVLLDILLWRP